VEEGNLLSIALQGGGGGGGEKNLDRSLVFSGVIVCYAKLQECYDVFFPNF
jgi:hypothetical protein